MRSMTGFGQGEALAKNGNILFRVEISSVNRKQFELKMALPRSFSAFEPQIRKLVGNRISRGTLSLRVEAISKIPGYSLDSNIAINEFKFESIRKFLEKKTDSKALSAEAMTGILALPGIIEDSGTESANAEYCEALLSACSYALDSLIKMRTTEGENLKKDLSEKIVLLETMLRSIEPYAAALPDLQKERLLKRVHDADIQLEQNDERLAKELVLFADRYDVSEEITRLKSHFSHFRTFLAEDREALGRNMDFLTQEIFREINTLGNKAASTEISPIIVSMKSETEKIREQTQNIE